MKLNVLENLREKFIKALQGIGNFINQVPTKTESKKIRRWSETFPGFLKKAEVPIGTSQRQKDPKGSYGHKGSAYKGKGNINTDAATFQHPRKEVPEGKGRRL